MSSNLAGNFSHGITSVGIFLKNIKTEHCTRVSGWWNHLLYQNWSSHSLTGQVDISMLKTLVLTLHCRLVFPATYRCLYWTDCSERTQLLRKSSASSLLFSTKLLNLKNIQNHLQLLCNDVLSELLTALMTFSSLSLRWS